MLFYCIMSARMCWLTSNDAVEILLRPIMYIQKRFTIMCNTARLTLLPLQCTTNWQISEEAQGPPTQCIYTLYRCMAPEALWLPPPPPTHPTILAATI